MPTLSLELKLPQPYDWPALLQFFAARVIPGVDEVQGTTYRRTFSIGKASGTLALAPTSRTTLRADLAAKTPIPDAQASARINRLLNIAAPARVIARYLASDPRLAPLIAKRPGLHVPGAWDPFELGVRAILGQQVSVAGATTLAGRIALKFGRGLTTKGSTLTHLFPTAATLTTADLAGLGLTTRRAATITGFAEAACNAPALLDYEKPLETFIADLVQLKGFGPWTAHYMAMRLGYADAFPASDLGIRKALGMAPEKEILQIAEAWRPWRAAAAIHLWSSL